MSQSPFPDPVQLRVHSRELYKFPVRQEPFCLLSGAAALTIGSPYVLYTAEGNQYDVNLFTSQDGLSWVKHPGSPVLTHGPPGSWDGANPETPYVVYLPELHPTRPYRMYYAGRDAASWTHEIGLATSDDGVHFEKHQASPVLSHDPQRAWEAKEISRPLVFPVGDGTLGMLYIGFAQGSSLHSSLCFASSGDGGFNWQKAAQPVLEATLPWENGQIGYPWLYRESATRWVLFYVGGYPDQKIGWATSQGSPLVWQKENGGKPMLRGYCPLLLEGDLQGRKRLYFTDEAEQKSMKIGYFGSPGPEAYPLLFPATSSPGEPALSVQRGCQCVRLGEQAPATTRLTQLPLQGLASEWLDVNWEVASTLEDGFGLHLSPDGIYENGAGLGEKWFIDSAGSWYFILPSGVIYKGGSAASAKAIAITDPRFHDLRWLTEPAPVATPLEPYPRRSPYELPQSILSMPQAHFSSSIVLEMQSLDLLVRYELRCAQGDDTLVSSLISDIRAFYGFRLSSGGGWLQGNIWKERWFIDQSGNWYFILPSGEVYAGGSLFAARLKLKLTPAQYELYSWLV